MFDRHANVDVLHQALRFIIAHFVKIAVAHIYIGSLEATVTK